MVYIQAYNVLFLYASIWQLLVCCSYSILLCARFLSSSGNIQIIFSSMLSLPEPTTTIHRHDYLARIHFDYHPASGVSVQDYFCQVYSIVHNVFCNGEVESLLLNYSDKQILSLPETTDLFILIYLSLMRGLTDFTSVHELLGLNSIVNFVSHLFSI